MFSQKTHRKIFIFFLLLLAIGLTFGKIILSISMIGLTINWLFEGEFSEKHQRIKKRKYIPYYLAGIFLIEDLIDVPLVGPIFSDVLKKHPDIEISRQIHEAVRRLIGAMVTDLIEETTRRLNELDLRSAEE